MIPLDFLDPITLEIIAEPVIAADGLCKCLCPPPPPLPLAQRQATSAHLTTRGSLAVLGGKKKRRPTRGLWLDTTRLSQDASEGAPSDQGLVVAPGGRCVGGDGASGQTTWQTEMRLR